MLHPLQLKTHVVEEFILFLILIKFSLPEGGNTHPLIVKLEAVHKSPVSSRATLIGTRAHCECPNLHAASKPSFFAHFKERPSHGFGHSPTYCSPFSPLF